MRQFMRIICSGSIAFGALKVSLVVGTILNLINQGDRLSSGQALAWGQIVMNHVVPYCVSSYSAARAVMRSSGKRK